MVVASPRNRFLIGTLITAFAVVASVLLVWPEWHLPPLSLNAYWNGAVAFLITAFLCDAWWMKTSFANVTSSVAYLPFFASVLLFDHPIPMMISGVVAAFAETFVRRKPPMRVVFNTCQYMVALGLGGMVYSALGGSPILGRDALTAAGANPEFTFKLLPFIGLIVTYFVVNQGSVALAVAFSSGITIRESWQRVGGGARVYDFLGSSLAILLAFLYVKLELVGLIVVVSPIFLVRQLYHMNLQLQDEMEEKLELMVKAIEARDPYTSGHSRRVAEYAGAIARDLQLNAREVDAVKRAALLHDVGKIYEEFAPLLRKEDKLSAEERIVMQTHVTRSAELVGTVSKLRGHVLDAVRHHHENYDGSGYPDGIVGEGIPIGARIIMIADTLDAMTTDRPYRKALGFDQVVGELRKYSGRQFDPRIADVLIKSSTIRRMIGAGEAEVPAATPVATFAGRFGGGHAGKLAGTHYRRARENATLRQEPL